jgi:hypothetical protein
MHQPAYTTKHTDVEMWAVHHILIGDNRMVRSEILDSIETVVKRCVELGQSTPEQSAYLDTVLQAYYTQKKYELILLIRRLTQERVQIMYKNVPFFKNIVSNYSQLVIDARSVKVYNEVKH